MQVPLSMTPLTLCVHVTGASRRLQGLAAAGRLVRADVGHVPTRDHVRPQGSPARSRARLQRAVRAADQPVQREDLPVRLVLAGAGRRRHAVLADDVDRAVQLPARAAALRQASPQVRPATRPGGGPQAEGERVCEALPEPRRRVRAAPAGAQHQHGNGHRVRDGAVGQLQGQAHDAVQR